MRKVTFGGANSLDNYLARTNHAVDWLLWSEEVTAVMADYWKTIDTVLMGRKTYEVAIKQSKGGVGGPTVKTYVFSRTLKVVADASVTLISTDAADFVRELKQRDGKAKELVGLHQLGEPWNSVAAGRGQQHHRPSIAHCVGAAPAHDPL